jgi:hypothetical protein
MKPFNIFLYFLFISLVAGNSFAATKNITINWAESGTIDCLGYKMYYAYSSDMSDKLVACQSDNASINSLTCNDIELLQSPVYFTIAALTAEGEKISPAVSQSFDTQPTIISKVKGFAISPPTTNLAKYAINFQPEDAPLPEGFTSDSGKDYSNAQGYGWIGSPGTIGPRDRDNPEASDQSYDTLLYVNADGIWEFALESGSYTVTICVGDPWWPNSTNVIRAEGTIVLNESVNYNQRWIERSRTVNVTDGRLTLTFTGSTPEAQLSWIKINPQ